MQPDSEIFADDTERRHYLKTLQSMLIRGRPTDALLEVEQKVRNLRNSEGLRLGLSVRDHEALVVKNWAQLWDYLSLCSDSEPNITAISLDLSWPGHISLEPDEDGKLSPLIETNFYSDGPYPFTIATREEYELAVEYRHSPWAGEFEHIDVQQSIEGIDQLYGSVQLQASKPDRTPSEEDAYQLNAALAAIAVHIAVKRTVIEHGIPKSLAILVGSNEDFPFFDAPVVTFSESLNYICDAALSRQADEQKEPAANREEESSEDGVTRNSRKNQKKAENRQRAEEWADEVSDQLAASFQKIITNPRTRKTIATVGTAALDVAHAASSSEKRKRAFREIQAILKKI